VDAALLSDAPQVESPLPSPGSAARFMTPRSELRAMVARKKQVQGALLRRMREEQAQLTREELEEMALQCVLAPVHRAASMSMCRHRCLHLYLHLYLHLHLHLHLHL
jgi:hypothetical protein